MNIFNKIDDAITKTKRLYREDATRVSEYDVIDHSTMIANTEKLDRLLRRQRKVYKFLGVTKEDFENALQTGTGKKRKIRHIVTAYDTLFSIASKYKIEAGLLLANNNLTSPELIAGTEITIEVESEEPGITGQSDLPIIGEHRGIELLGRDLNITLLPDSRGDLHVLEPEATVKQGVKIRLNTRQGDYPGKDGFGINDYFKYDLPPELKLAVIDKEAEISLTADLRIKSIDAIQTVESVNPKTAGNIEVTAEVTTIS